jgi:phosphoesterase RecJ-like protein
MYDTQLISQLQEQLNTPKKIVIITHTHPDGDAVGSSLGLYHCLIQQNHHVQVIVPNTFPSFLTWMKDADKVLDYEKNPAEAEAALEACDILFMLDFNKISRVDKLATPAEACTAYKVVIDHHIEPDIQANLIFSEVKACSTCQMIFEIVEQLQMVKSIPLEAAECLYCGIMTDTGSFRFDSTTADTHRIVAQLIDCGVVKSKIHGSVYDNNTLDKIQLVSYCLAHNLHLHRNNKVATITLNEEEQKRFNMQKGDTEGLVNHGLSVNGVMLSAFFTHRDGIVKISFRSKGDIDVNAFSRKYFEGGGHKNAAGGKSEMLLEATVEKFLSVVHELI